MTIGRFHLCSWHLFSLLKTGLGRTVWSRANPLPCACLPGAACGEEVPASSPIALPMCVECQTPLDACQSSCLPGYCAACFAHNVKQNEALVKRTLPSSDCVVCGCNINVDNKSPVPKCCFACWTAQEAAYEKIPLQEELRNFPRLPKSYETELAALF